MGETRGCRLLAGQVRLACESLDSQASILKSKLLRVEPPVKAKLLMDYQDTLLPLSVQTGKLELEESVRLVLR